MTERIWVQVAGDDRRVPVEGQRGVYFESGEKHQVRHTPFIQRRIDEGDLVKVDAPVAKASSAATPATELPPAVADRVRAEVLGTGLMTGGTTTASATAGAASEKGA